MRGGPYFFGGDSSTSLRYHSGMATTSKKGKKTTPAKAKNSGKRAPVVRVHPGESPRVVGGTVNYEVEVYIPPDIVAHYADNLSVTHTEYEFIISFLQLQPPILLEGNEQPQDEKVLTKCLARIAVNPARIPLFIETLIKNWNRYQTKMQEVEKAYVNAQQKAVEGGGAG
jgi:Protein of unknown function (DUF3467)